MTLTVKIPDNCREELERFCKENGVTPEDAPGECIRRFLALRRFDRLAAKTEAAARAAGFKSEEEILKACRT